MRKKPSAAPWSKPADRMKSRAVCLQGRGDCRALFSIRKIARQGARCRHPIPRCRTHASLNRRPCHAGLTRTLPATTIPFLPHDCRMPPTRDAVMRRWPFALSLSALAACASNTTHVATDTRSEANNVPIEQVCAHAQCVSDVHVRLKDKGGKSFERTFDRMPVIQPAGVSVYAGQTVRFEADDSKGELVNLRLVESGGDPARTIEFRLEQTPEGSMIVVTKKPVPAAAEDPHGHDAARQRPAVEDVELPGHRQRPRLRALAVSDLPGLSRRPQPAARFIRDALRTSRAATGRRLAMTHAGGAQDRFSGKPVQTRVCHRPTSPAPGLTKGVRACP